MTLASTIVNMSFEIAVHGTLWKEGAEEEAAAAAAAGITGVAQEAGISCTVASANSQAIC